MKAKRSTNVEIKVIKSNGVIPSGLLLKAKSGGFGCTITSGAYAGEKLNKAFYMVKSVLPA